MANLILWNSFGPNYAPVRPLGCHQLATWLEQFGYTVQVVDFCNLMSVDDLVSLTRKYIDETTIAVGVSRTFWKNRMDPSDSTGEPQWCLDARNVLEPNYPQLRWLLGGAEYIVEQKKLEWITFEGMAEDTLLRFMDHNTKHVLTRPLFDIQTLQKHHKSNLMLDPQEVLSLEMSRGCQFKCSFCRYPLIGKKKGTYIRSISLVEQELVENYERYGTTRYTIVDDTVNEDEDKIKGLAQVAQRLPFQLEWVGYLRLDLIGSKKHTIGMLRDSGLRGAFFGVESFHADASKVVGKGWNGVHGKDFLKELKLQWPDIAIQLGLIAGLPFETAKDLYDTNQWCIDNEIHNWGYNPLHISIGNINGVQSDFDKNYQKYGFSFPDSAKPHSWINDHWSSESAYEIVNTLNAISKPFLKPGIWHAANLANLGYSFDWLFSQRVSDLRYSTFQQRTREFVNRYVQSHLLQK